MSCPPCEQKVSTAKSSLESLERKKFVLLLKESNFQHMSGLQASDDNGVGLGDGHVLVMVM